ncbi:MAG: hypothetical protein ABI634_14025 [Acidobacteriota bacterium]
MDGTQLYRVKLGALLPHDGGVLVGGTDVELRPDIAHEVRHLVNEVTATGEERPIGFKDRAEAELAAAVAAAKPHERISLLENARKVLLGDLEKLDAQIDAEQQRLAADEKKRAAPEAKPGAEQAADVKKPKVADAKTPEAKPAAAADSK